jgi:hypothetical protein
MGIMTVASLAARVTVGRRDNDIHLQTHQLGRKLTLVIRVPLRMDTQRRCFSPPRTPSRAAPAGMPQRELRRRRVWCQLGMLSGGFSLAVAPRLERSVPRAKYLEQSW